MRLSADAVADQANFMDLRILSTMGLTGADLGGNPGGGRDFSGGGRAVG
ncbi:MAG: hypothetical protein V8S96_01160 [Lachnospiraceae bacterium]